MESRVGHDRLGLVCLIIGQHLSLIHIFVVLWAVTYGIIAVVKWLTDNWVLVLCIMGGVVAVVGIAAVIAIIIRKRKNKAGLEVSTDESN